MQTFLPHFCPFSGDVWIPRSLYVQCERIYRTTSMFTKEGIFDYGKFVLLETPHTWEASVLLH